MIGWAMVWHDFMREDLGLKGCELFVYAVIHEYTFNKGGFSDNLKCLEEYTGYTQYNICRVLKKLVNKGYIRKNAINARCIKYKTVPLNELKINPKSGR